jgi:hypothetical protein
MLFSKRTLSLECFDITAKALAPRRFIRASRDFPRRSIISATLRSLRVEEEERLVSEEQSDEFQVFPERRRRAEITQSGYVATEGKSPEMS